MADPAADPQQPSPEELQAYLEQMRAADVAEIVAQAFQILAMGAEVKVGQADSRTLIDALSAVTDATKGKVPSDLSNGMSNAVQQLQMAQVQAERVGQEAGGDQAQASGPGPEAGQAGRPDPTQSRPSGKQNQGGQNQGEQGQGGQKMTDRLWVPGQ